MYWNSWYYFEHTDRFAGFKPLILTCLNPSSSAIEIFAGCLVCWINGRLSAWRKHKYILKPVAETGWNLELGCFLSNAVFLEQSTKSRIAGKWSQVINCMRPSYVLYWFPSEGWGKGRRDPQHFALKWVNPLWTAMCQCHCTSLKSQKIKESWNR